MAFRERRRNRNQLPDWLWFFLIVPLGLVVALLWRLREQRFALAHLGQGNAAQGGKRYTEPDSIPIETHMASEPYRERGDFAELGVDEEDVAQASIPLREETAQDTGMGGAEQARSQQVQEQPEAEGQPDDLVIIEGIGPSIAGLLRDRGIRTFNALASTPVDRLQDILVSARLQHLASPETWPEQARMAAEGRWDDLKALQRTLKGGRRNTQA